MAVPEPRESVWLYRHAWADRIKGQRVAIWVGSRALDGVRLRAEARREGQPGQRLSAWGHVRAEPAEARRWGDAAEAYLDAEDAARAELDRAVNRRPGWWRRRRAQRRYEAMMAAAEAAYAPWRTTAAVRLEHEIARREAEEQRTRLRRVEHEAVRQSEEQRDRQARDAAFATLDGQRVWMLACEGRVARVHRCDVAPRRTAGEADGPLTAWELAVTLAQREVDRVDWDPEALKSVEATIGASQFRAWWDRHRGKYTKDGQGRP